MFVKVPIPIALTLIGLYLEWKSRMKSRAIQDLGKQTCSDILQRSIFFQTRDQIMYLHQFVWLYRKKVKQLSQHNSQRMFILQRKRCKQIIDWLISRVRDSRYRIAIYDANAYMIIRSSIIFNFNKIACIGNTSYLTFVPQISITNDWISLSVILFMWPFRTCKDMGDKK